MQVCSKYDLRQSNNYVTFSRFSRAFSIAWRSFWAHFRVCLCQEEKLEFPFFPPSWHMFLQVEMQVTQCYLLATTFRGRDDCRSMRWKSSLKSNFFSAVFFKDFAKLLVFWSSHTKMSIKWSSSNNTIKAHEKREIMAFYYLIIVLVILVENQKVYIWIDSHQWDLFLSHFKT